MTTKKKKKEQGTGCELTGDLFLDLPSKSSKVLTIVMRNIFVHTEECHTGPHRVLGVSSVLPDVSSKHGPQCTFLPGFHHIWLDYKLSICV